MTDTTTSPASTLLDHHALPDTAADRLRRAERAADLLGALTADLCERNGIRQDSIAAVADYIRDDVRAALTSLRPIASPMQEVGDV